MPSGLSVTSTVIISQQVKLGNNTLKHKKYWWTHILAYFCRLQIKMLLTLTIGKREGAGC